MVDDPSQNKTPEEPLVAETAGDAKGKKGKGKSDKTSGKNSFGTFWSSLSNKEKNLIRITCFVLTAVLLDIIVIRPINEYLNRINDESEVEENVIPKRLSILKHKDKIIKEYRSYKRYMADSSLSQEEAIAKLLRDIEKESKEVGLFVSNINPVKTEKKMDSIIEMSVDIEGKGALDQIRSFMKLLEVSNPAIQVRAFSLRAKGKDSDELKYTFTIVKLSVKERSI